MLNFRCLELLALLEERDRVESYYREDKDDSENLSPAGEESVDGASLVLGEEGIRAACYNAYALLITLLEDNYDDDSDGHKDKK